MKRRQTFNLALVAVLAFTLASLVVQAQPVALYRFEDGAATNGAPARNSSKEKSPAPDGVYSGTVKLVAGPARTGGRAASFAGAGVVEIPHHAVFDAPELAVEFWFRSTQLFDRTFWPASATLVSKATAGAGSGDWCILGGSLQGV